MRDSRPRDLTVPLATAGMLVFVAATGRRLGWAGGYHLMHAGDEVDYRRIATAAPSLPAAGTIGEQHAQRFAFHWLIGVVARLLNINVVTAYEAAVPLAIIAICLVCAHVLSRIGAGRNASVLCMALLVLNPYSFRYYLLAPGYVADLLFELGILTVMCGLFSGRDVTVFAGVAFAALARQTALPAAVAVGVAVAFWPGRRERGRGHRVALALIPVVIAAGIYLAEDLVARGFSRNTTPSLANWTMLSELERLPAGAGTLFAHLLRSVNGLFAVLVLIAVATICLRRACGRGVVADSARFWGCVLIGGSIVVQPMIFSAGYASGNESRLALLGLTPLVCAFAVVLRALAEHARQLTRRALLVLLAILAVDSLHHIFTVIRTGSAARTVALEIVCALACGGILAIGLKPRTVTGPVTIPSGDLTTVGGV